MYLCPLPPWACPILIYISFALSFKTCIWPSYFICLCCKLPQIDPFTQIPAIHRWRNCSSAEGVVTCLRSLSQYWRHLAKKTYVAGRWRLHAPWSQPDQSFPHSPVTACMHVRIFVVSEFWGWKIRFFKSKNRITPIFTVPQRPREIGLW